MAGQHARFTSKGREVFVTDLGSPSGTTLNDRQLQPHKTVRLAPGDHLWFGKSGKEGTEFFVKMCHNKARPGLCLLAVRCCPAAATSRRKACARSEPRPAGW